LCIFLLFYLIVPFLNKQDWWEILKNTFVPTIKFNKEFIGILVAILGTTISPYLFFWQATMEVEDVKQQQRHLIVNRNTIQKMTVDIDFGMLFSNIVMFFIILTTGTVLFKGGIHQINTVEQAASALKPLAGESAYLLFALGVISTGLLAIPVLSGSLSYIISETFDWGGGFDKKFQDAKAFYIIVIISMIIGLFMNLFGFSVVKALIYTAILYGITSPVIIAIVLHISNNKRLMGKFTNGIWSNISGAAALILMTASSLCLLYFQFFG
jgi:Mn2+/Fe2+ NRAMP family transporter